MLSLERPIGEIAGIQVFRDHRPDSGQFWYINDRPRIAVSDGEPEFVFVKFLEDYRETLSDTAREKLGGGFVTDIAGGRPAPADYLQDTHTGDYWPTGDIPGWIASDRLVGAACARG